MALRALRRTVIGSSGARPGSRENGRCESIESAVYGPVLFAFRQRCLLLAV